MHYSHRDITNAIVSFCLAKLFARCLICKDKKFVNSFGNTVSLQYSQTICNLAKKKWTPVNGRKSFNRDSYTIDFNLVRNALETFE